jgi:hypothetical protein
VILELERSGGFRKHLKSFDEYEDLARDLKKRFKFVGDSGVHFLWTVRYPVPDWRAWSKAHGIDWGSKARKPTGARPQSQASPVNVADATIGVVSFTSTRAAPSL